MEINPWDQLKGESNRDYARFWEWLNLADRNLIRAAPLWGLKTQTVRQLSAKWTWRERAIAYDLHQAELDEQDTRRNRVASATAVLANIRRVAEQRLTVPAEDIDPRDLKALSGSIKDLSPSLEVSVSQSTESSREDEVTIALRRAREVIEGGKGGNADSVE